MRLQMLIDANKCMNCKACILACQQRNNVPYDCSRNWVREIRVQPDNPEGLKPLSGMHYQPGNCMQCEEALCLRACPSGATYRGEDGVIHVTTSKCIGCGACADACPYDARFRHPTTKAIDKCDYCAASRVQGWEPACVGICPTHARIFGDAEDPTSEVSNVMTEARQQGNLSHVESSATPTQPSVAYIGQTTPKDWPRAAQVPTPLALMHPVSKGVQWLGGAVLMGILAVGIRNR